jgi:transforming growth factor-beta-induced protein
MKHFLLCLLLCSPFVVGCDDDPAPAPAGGAMTGGDTGGDTGGTTGGDTGGDTGGATEDPKSIAETAQEAGVFTTLLTAIDAAGLTEDLMGEGPFTILAPNDDAFADLPDGTVESLVEDAQNGGSLLANILTLHVISGAILSSDLVDGGSAETLNGTLSVSVGDTVTFTSGDTVATVLTADVIASNGVIHIIDTVLLPVEPEALNLVETAEAAGNFTILLAAVEAAGLAPLVLGDSPLTILAPTDDAFAALPEGTVDTLLADAAEGGNKLAGILSLHAIEGSVLSTDLEDGANVTTLGGSLTVNVSEDGVTFTSGNIVANVISADILASNGVIHAIDQVLLPPEPELVSIPATAEAAGNFMTLLAAVEAAGLTDTLLGPGPFTVLAPNDDAFATLPEGTVQALLDDAANDGTQLADILTLHVINGSVLSTDLMNGPVETLNGTLTVNTDNGVVFTTAAENTATVIAADITASNGVIHVIDKVLQ